MTLRFWRRKELLVTVNYNDVTAPPEWKWNEGRKRVPKIDPADMTNNNQDPFAWALGRALRSTKGKLRAASPYDEKASEQVIEARRKLALLDKTVNEDERQTAETLLHSIVMASSPSHCLDAVGRVLDWSVAVRRRLYRARPAHDKFTRYVGNAGQLDEKRVLDVMISTLKAAEEKLCSMKPRPDNKSFFRHYSALRQAFDHKQHSPDARQQLIQQYQTNLPLLKPLAAFAQMYRSKVQLNEIECSWLVKMYYASLYCPRLKGEDAPSGPLEHAALIYKGLLSLNYREIVKQLDNALAKEKRLQARKPSTAREPNNAAVRRSSKSRFYSTAQEKHSPVKRTSPSARGLSSASGKNTSTPSPSPILPKRSR